MGVAKFAAISAFAVPPELDPTRRAHFLGDGHLALNKDILLEEYMYIYIYIVCILNSFYWADRSFNNSKSSGNNKHFRFNQKNIVISKKKTFQNSTQAGAKNHQPNKKILG